MKTTDRIRNWTQGRAGRFLLTQLAHTTFTVVVLAALLFGAARVGALDGVLAPAAAPAADTTFTTINYQGRLADSGGTPISDLVTMQFSFYDLDSGGTLLWGPETHPSVPVTDGLFSVRLGSQPTPGGIPADVFSGGDVWLETTVEGEVLSPREKLTAVPHAIQAGLALTVADGAVDTAQIVDGAVGTAQILDGAVTRAKAPGLIASTTNNTEIQYGRVDAQATGTVGQLTVDIDFEPDFPSAPRLFLQPAFNQTPSVIATYGSPCNSTMCRVFLVRADGGQWQNGQWQNVYWVAIGQR